MAQTLSPSTVNLINTCAGQFDPNGAVSLRMPPDWNRQRHLSGVWWDTNKFPAAGSVSVGLLNAFMQQTPPGLEPRSDLLFTNAASPTWWTVNLWGIEVVRLVLVGAPAVRPLMQDMLIATGLRHTRIPARVTWENMQVSRSVDLDIGSGTRFSVLANAVHVQLLLPDQQRFLDVGSTTNTANLPVLGPGLVLDSMVGGSCYPCFAPLPNRYPTLTQRLLQLRLDDGGTPLFVPIPPGAKYLTIYRTNDVPGVPWRWQPVSGIVAGANQMGVINYDPTVNAVIRRPVPQNVSGIMQPAVRPGTGTPVRGWTFIWELEL